MDKRTFSSCTLLYLLISMLTTPHMINALTKPNLRGRVMDWNNNGVPYAVVKLHKAGLQVQTDLTGYFAFNSTNPVHQSTAGYVTGPALQLRGTTLLIDVAGSNLPVSATLFSVSGKKIADILTSQYIHGSAAVDIARWMSSSQLMIIQVINGNETFNVPVLSLLSEKRSLCSYVCKSSISSVSTLSGDRNSMLEKRSTANGDSITVTHFGYNPVTLQLPVLDTMIDTVKLFYEFRKDGDPAGMIRVPGGVFTMGRNALGNMAHPAHTVFVSPYFIDSTELPQKEYTDLTGKEPWLKNANAASSGCGPRYPAWHVNWYDAVNFCNQRSKKFGLDTVYTWSSVEGELGNNGELLNVEDHFDRNGYRLPTEAEWEYACRAGTRTLYYWGATADSAISSRYVWTYYNSKPASLTHEVAMLLPNPLHLYDIAGNQCEWCNDQYATYTDAFQENPKIALGRKSPGDYVLRSAPHGQSAGNYTTTNRGVALPGTTDPNAILGFRVVLPVKDK